MYTPGVGVCGLFVMEKSTRILRPSISWKNQINLLSFRQNLQYMENVQYIPGVAKLFGSRAKFQEKLVLRAAKKSMKQNLCLFLPKRG